MTATTTPPDQDAVESEFRGGESPVRRRQFASAAPPRAPLRAILVATLTCLGGLTVLVGLGTLSGHVLLIPSLAGTMALVAGAPHLPLSRSRATCCWARRSPPAPGWGRPGQPLALGCGHGREPRAPPDAAEPRGALARDGEAAVLGTSTVSGRGSFVLCVLTAAVAIVLVAVVQLARRAGDYPVYWW